jgi:hypothetical protein
VHETGDVDLAVGLGVPRSTANGWVRHAPPEVVTLDVFEMDGARLHREVVKLRRRVQILTTVVGLLVTVARALGTSLEQRRVGDDRRRRAVMRAIERGRRILPLRSVLRVIGLSSSRYHAWTSGEPACAAEDAPRPDEPPRAPRSTGWQGVRVRVHLVPRDQAARLAPASVPHLSLEAEGRIADGRAG